MNVVLVLIDSLNRHHLSAYAESPAHTPNLDAFAQRAWRFDGHFVGSLPCMPARREIFAGFKEMFWRAWGPLETFDLRLPRLLEDAGYQTAIVTDHYHYWEESANGYVQSFAAAELIRGHEADFWRPPIGPDEPLPRWVENIERWRPNQGRRYFANVRDFAGEEDFFPAKVMGGAARWLERHAAREPFFLQVESFDVHEPFHVPEPYASMYGPPPGDVDFTVWPPYQKPEEQAAYMSAASPAELAFVRAQYLGKLAMVDRWFGELTTTFDRLGLWEDTAVIVTTDHGHDLGERGRFGKQYPHHDTHAKIPLLFWHPDHPGGGRGVDRLTATVDLHATVLDLAGLGSTAPHSRSILPLLAEGALGREALLYGTFGAGVCITDGEWTLMKGPETDAVALAHTSSHFRSLMTDRAELPLDQGLFIPGVEVPQWRVPVKMVNSQPHSLDSALYHSAVDPEQQEDRYGSDIRERRRMLGLLRELVDAEGAPPEERERLGIDS